MDQNYSFISLIAPFVIGGLSGALATSVIQPIDTLKVQVQCISEQIGRNKGSALTIPNIFMKIRSDHGLQVLYRGLDSAIFRQLFYASARLGAYDSSVQFLQKNKNRKASQLERAGLSFVSGAFGALVGNPFDVALIRKQASITNGKNCYKNTFQAFKTIIKQEGVLSLWSGLNITIVRVAIINFGQLAGRDMISDSMRRWSLSKEVHNNVVAVFASVLTAVLSLPVDNVKVKLQKQQKNQQMYKGIWDCLTKTVRRQGIPRLWVGFPIYLVRGAPHSFILIKSQFYLTQKWKSRQVKF